MDFGNYCWNLPTGSLMKRMLKAEAHEGFNTAPGGKLKCTTKWGWIVKGLKLDFRAIELTENYTHIYINTYIIILIFFWLAAHWSAHTQRQIAMLNSGLCQTSCSDVCAHVSARHLCASGSKILQRVGCLFRNCVRGQNGEKSFCQCLAEGWRILL